MAWSLFANQPTYDGAPAAPGQSAGILGLFPKAPAYQVPKATSPSTQTRTQFAATLSEDEKQVHLRVHIPRLLSFEGSVPTAHVLLTLCQALPLLSEMACAANGATANPEREEGEEDELM